MSRLFPHRPHPPLAGADLAYVCTHFVSLERLAPAEAPGPGTLRDWVEAAVLPRPAYVLPDGTAMFPPDLLGLVRSAGGPGRVKDHFRERVALTGRMLGVEVPGTAWEDYLSGEYGICLREVTPETLVLKEALVRSLEARLARQAPESAEWRAAVEAEVRGLDALLRRFASVDATRFGRPTSRERLVDGPRRRWPSLAGGPGPLRPRSADADGP